MDFIYCLWKVTTLGESTKGWTCWNSGPNGNWIVDCLCRKSNQNS
ncbi:hypothetical protein ZEAMMB73_Zm00001d040106 [Zea mays]|uniref:Uncharacterized protein n=1 Tax=Zea mays TaxID=4577 RepID=A0A1D6MN39_MAIZE|nr:hypothetical protein ZEAMMB73_Zm00001d040106 [Zea mays]